MNRTAVLSSAICLVLSVSPIAHADETSATPADSGNVNELQRMQVTATRSRRPVADVPNSVDVIDREQIDEHVVDNIKQLVRYEPGVSVNSSYGRFGLGDFRIRGLEGNRVSLLVDGIPESDAFSIGSYTNANRNFVDLDTLKRVEIVRGPSSALYGSDALGGVVSFITKDPSDYLAEGKDAYFGFKYGYDGSWNGVFGGATVAFGGNHWSGLVAIGHRQGHETENRGDVASDDSTRTKPNPQDKNGHSLLGKLVYAPSANQRFKLTAETNEDKAKTNVLSGLGDDMTVYAHIGSLTGNDDQQRKRVSFKHELDALDSPLADSLDWQVYWQGSETTQRTRLQRTSLITSVPILRDTESDFDQHTWGLQANLHKSFGNSVRHDLSYGIDLARTRTEEERNGLQTNLDTGATTHVVGPDTFPVRDFPNSKTTTAALYAQDEIAFAGGAFRLVPGVRVDHYELKPDIDGIFAVDNPGQVAADISKTSVSPKLGMVWHLTDAWSLFGGYSRGFRAPPYNDVNIGFTNLMYGYTAIANPDLKPETSNGFELGLRFSGDAAYASLSGYYNRYKNFIESEAFVGFNDEGLMVFQSRNVTKAEIHGAELKAGVDFGALSPSWAGWSLRGAAAWSYGQDQTADVPLDTVDPLTAALGLSYDGDRWGAELSGRFVGRKRRVSDTATYYRQPGYATLDLYAHWNLAPGAKLNLGVLNLTDRKYWESGDVTLVDRDNLLDRYTAPGRSVSASITVEWW